MLSPVTLKGSNVRLEPLALRHAAGLFEASRDPEIWKYLLVPQPQSEMEMGDWIRLALDAQAAGQQLPFAIVGRDSRRILGTTRFLEIRMPDRALEIGWTWLAAEAQRTVVNTESKFLLLRYAFETLGMERVQLKTDAENTRSRLAIERLGAHLEGILRRYQRYWHGRQRDTAMYAILREDWPEVKSRLEAQLARISG